MSKIVCILTIVINAIAPWGRDALDGYYGTYAVKTDKDKMARYLEKGEEDANAFMDASSRTIRIIRIS